MPLTVPRFPLEAQFPCTHTRVSPVASVPTVFPRVMSLLAALGCYILTASFIHVRARWTASLHHECHRMGCTRTMSVIEADQAIS